MCESPEMDSWRFQRFTSLLFATFSLVTYCRATEATDDRQRNSVGAELTHSETSTTAAEPLADTQEGSKPLGPTTALNDAQLNNAPTNPRMFTQADLTAIDKCCRELARLEQSSGQEGVGLAGLVEDCQKVLDAATHHQVIPNIDPDYREEYDALLNSARSVPELTARNILVASLGWV
jgi:hypothetical protein